MYVTLIIQNYLHPAVYTILCVSKENYEGVVFARGSGLKELMLYSILKQVFIVMQRLTNRSMSK